MKVITVLFGLIIVLTGCNHKIEEDIVARVNTEVLTMSELRANFSEAEWVNTPDEIKKEFINQWVELTLLSQAAIKQGLNERPELKLRIQTAIKTQLANSLLAQEIRGIEVKEDDIFDYYKLNKSAYQTTVKEYKIQRIFIRDKAKLDSVMEELRKGMPYTDAVKTYSEENLGRNGGYTGFLSQADMGKAVWNKINSLQKWQYTSVETEDGYYIIRYYDVRDREINTDFTEVREEIRTIVWESKKKEFYEKLINELKQNSDIIISQ